MGAEPEQRKNGFAHKPRNAEPKSAEPRSPREGPSNNTRRLLLRILLGVAVVSLLAQAALVTPWRDRISQLSTPFLGSAVPSSTYLAPSEVAPGLQRETGWVAAMRMLRNARRPYVIIDAKNGLGNRLRALASAMAMAASLQRPVLLVWVPDLHCNCSFRKMFATPLQFALLEEEIPKENLTSDEFQVYNYMRPEPGAVKDAPVSPDGRRHIYFKSGFIMNHPFGGWKYAQRQLQRLVPVEEVERMLVATKGTVGLHIRNVFDAPRDEATNTSVVGKEAVLGAQKEYGVDGTRALMAWRKASHWSNFVPRIISLLREHGFRHPSGLAQQPLQFYLAADSEEAYTGLTKRFPNRILFTQRQCASSRCDFRDCAGMLFSLVDMLNLARTHLILGSGWSSYSEVAAYIGGHAGKPVPILMAGRDFGVLVNNQRNSRAGPKPPCCNVVADEDSRDAEVAAELVGNLALEATHTNEVDDQLAIQQYWPRPF